MLIKAATLKGYKLVNLDGEMGKVSEFYFDDLYWAIRYLAADTGNYLFGRQVLISPFALGAVIQSEKYIKLDLTKKKLEDGPALNSGQPVSRQFEEDYFQYYRWPKYWANPYDWGQYARIEQDTGKSVPPASGGKEWDSNLRSSHDVCGLHVKATDGNIGHVEDFIIDDETWTIRYLVIAMQNWWPGKRVLVSPHWLERISWDKSTIFIDILRETIRLTPEYTEDTNLDRAYELSLHQHYKRPANWNDVLADKLASRQKNP